MIERRLRGGVLLQADAAAPETVARVREMFGPHPIGLVVADPGYGEVVSEDWDTSRAVTGLKWSEGGADEAYAAWMIGWTQLWSEALADGGAMYVWGGVGRPRFRPFFHYLARVERATGLSATPITWKKKRGYGVAHNYLFAREECVYLAKGDPRKPRRFHIPLTDKLRGYKGYNKDYPAKSEYLRRATVWVEDGAGCPRPGEEDEAVEYRMDDVWDETEVLRGKVHECQKARRVCEIPIEVHTDPGDGVVDLFSGSGELSLAARRLGRAWIAVERDAATCEKIAARMSEVSA